LPFQPFGGIGQRRAVRAELESVADASPARGLDVPGTIADHRRGREVEAEFARRLQQHSRLRLATVAAIDRMMRAVVDGFDAQATLRETSTLPVAVRAEGRFVVVA